MKRNIINRFYVTNGLDKMNKSLDTEDIETDIQRRNLTSSIY